MPRNVNGTYSLPLPPVVPDTVIEAEWANTTDSDIAQALTDSLDRYGRGGMVAPFRLVDGTVGAPALSFAAETGTGLYRESSGVMALAVQGVQVGSWSSNGLTVPAGKSVNTNLVTTGQLQLGLNAGTTKILVGEDAVVPDGSDIIALGSAAAKWSVVYSLEGNFTAVITPDIYAPVSTVTITGDTTRVVVGNGAFYPVTGNTTLLGGSSNRWSTVFGDVGNFAGDVTTPRVQDGANLQLIGGASAVNLGAGAMYPAGSTLDLGGPSNRWSTVYGSAGNFTSAVVTPQVTSSSPLTLTGAGSSVVVGASELYPGTNLTYNLGSIAQQWKTIYAQNAAFSGGVSVAALSVSGTVTVDTLSVTGSGTLSGNLTVGGNVAATTMSTTGTATLGALTVGGATSLASLGVSGTSTLASLSVLGAANLDTLTTSGGASLAALTVSGSVSLPSARFVSTEIACPTNTANLSQAHGKGVAPVNVQAVLRCKVASQGWSVGDEIVLTDTENCGYQMWCNASSLGWVYSTTAAGAPEIRSATGVTARVTPANWVVVLKGIWL